MWRVVWVGLGVRRGERGDGERGEWMREGNRGSGRRYRGSVNEVVDTLYNLGSIKSYTDHAIINFEASRRFVYKSATPWQLFSIDATLHDRLDCHSSRILEGGVGGLVLLIRIC